MTRISTRRILVVDDNEDAAASLAALLQALGYEAKAVFDSRQAVEIATHFHPDAIISDLQMPHVSGFELGRNLSKLNPDFRLVALSADDSPQARTHSKECGFIAHLCKPCSIEAILAALA